MSFGVPAVARFSPCSRVVSQATKVRADLLLGLPRDLGRALLEQGRDSLRRSELDGTGTVLADVSKERERVPR